MRGESKIQMVIIRKTMGWIKVGVDHIKQSTCILGKQHWPKTGALRHPVLEHHFLRACCPKVHTLYDVQKMSLLFMVVIIYIFSPNDKGLLPKTQATCPTGAFNKSLSTCIMPEPLLGFPCYGRQDFSLQCSTVLLWNLLFKYTVGPMKVSEET